MKRIIKNNYQPNNVRTICPICKSVFEFDPKFDLEEEEFWVCRDGEVYELSLLYENAYDRGHVPLSYKRTVI